MAVVSIKSFRGANRALHPLYLPEGVGTVSLNHKPGRGDLRPWRNPVQVAACEALRGTVYRMGRASPSDTQYWVRWPGTVNAVAGFDIQDTLERTYYTGDGAPKVTDLSMVSASQLNVPNSRPLGIPAPLSGPTVATDAGTGTGQLTTYFYVYTYVSDWGWESAPSPPSAANTRASDLTAVVGGFAPVPLGNYSIDRLRVYRTQTGSSSTNFYFMREVLISAAAAGVADTNSALGEPLATTTWTPAPGIPQGGAKNFTESSMTGLVSLWNGMLAGIVDKAVRFSAPYAPYAWPNAYDLVPPDASPVALGVFGQQLLVLTTGRPLLVSGSGPEAMDQMPIQMRQGCVSVRSVVSMGYGVAWASNDGLCWFDQAGPRVLTDGVMTREDWQGLNPSSIIGSIHERMYVGSYDDGSGRKGFILDPDNPQGIFFLSTGYDAMHYDPVMDQLYVYKSSTTNISKWDAGSTFMTTTHRTGTLRLPRYAPAFAVSEVVADPAAFPVTVKFYADGTLVHTQTVTDDKFFRLPSGFHAQQWEFEIAAAGPVQIVNVAHSVQEITRA